MSLKDVNTYGFFPFQLTSSVTQSHRAQLAKLLSLEIKASEACLPGPTLRRYKLIKHVTLLSAEILNGKTRQISVKQ